MTARFRRGRDAFWLEGDPAFHRNPLTTSPANEASALQVRRLRASLNATLLTNERMVLTDTSLLINPPLRELIRAQPAYRQVLSDGRLVSLTRSGARSMSDVAEAVISGRNYSAMTPTQLRSFANDLDGLGVQHEPSPYQANLTRLNQRAEHTLLSADWWTGCGLPKYAAREATERASRFADVKGHIAQTPYWDYADELESTLPRAGFRNAQILRIHATLESLGVMSNTLGLRPHVPADYIRALVAHYSWPAPPAELTEDEAHYGARWDLRVLVAKWTPQQVLEVRRTAGLADYLRVKTTVAAGKAERLEEVGAADAYARRVLAQHGMASMGTGRQWSTLTTLSRGVGYGSALVGTVASTAGVLVASPYLALTGFVATAVAALQLVWDPLREKADRLADKGAGAALVELTDTMSDPVIAELYGPIVEQRR